jgi:hypothetical protein
LVIEKFRNFVILTDRGQAAADRVLKLLDYQITKLPNPLHTPEIVFLLLIVVAIRGDGQGHAECVSL